MIPICNGVRPKLSNQMPENALIIPTLRNCTKKYACTRRSGENAVLDKGVAFPFGFAQTLST